MTVAAVAAMVHLRDKLSWGILPGDCAKEIMTAYAGQVSAAVSGKPDDAVCCRQILCSRSFGPDNRSFPASRFPGLCFGLHEQVGVTCRLSFPPYCLDFRTTSTAMTKKNTPSAMV